MLSSRLRMDALSPRACLWKPPLGDLDSLGMKTEQSSVNGGTEFSGRCASVPSGAGQEHRCCTPSISTVEGREKGRKISRGIRGGSPNDEDILVEGSGIDAGDGVELNGEPRPRRPFCVMCRKPASLCICGRIKYVVKNQVGVTILQHPEERDHALGSARIAMLSLQNVQLIILPEVDEQVSYRIRPKVPGSKRSIAGRGGKKLQAQQKNQEVSMKKSGRSRVSAYAPSAGSLDDGAAAEISEQVRESGEMSAVPSWIRLPEGTGLLYPTDNAVELLPHQSSSIEGAEASSPELAGHAEMAGSISHLPVVNNLIVLDGTWSKARRIYCENPWLHSLPHFKLSTAAPSMSQCVRRQPKPGCLSTIESIVFALRVLEPETQGLDTLLDVFDSMIQDQKRFKEAKPRLTRTRS